MEPNLDDIKQLLGRTPAALVALLRGLPQTFIACKEGTNTWTAMDIVGHLVYAEKADWLPRIEIILRYGESRAFEPFDREGHAREVQGKSMEQLLNEFFGLRMQNLQALAAFNLQTSDMARRGQHPSLGVVTLRELLATWAAHDLTHLHQLSRLLAYQLRDEVGPWAKYLGVLKCHGHSEAA
jgi:hypothetical protein